MEENGSRKKGQKKFPIFLIFGLILFFIILGIFSKYASAANAPSIITYQGKLLIGSRLATTTQNMYFVLYDASSGGNILYTASGTIGAPQAVSTTPSQGLFSVNLGDTGTNALSPGIFQNNSSVYLEVRIGSDTLTPRKQITAVPYAFNARYLDGVGTNTVSSTTYIPVSDSSGSFTFNTTTVSSSLIVQSGAGTTTVFNVVSSTTGISLLRILTNGNVGINSSSPVDTLGIQGGLQIVGGVTSTNLYVSGLTNLGATTLTNLTATNVTSTNVSSTNSYSNSYTGTWNGSLLSITVGGTNSSTIAANGSIIYSDGTRYNASAVGTLGYLLMSAGAGAPVWINSTTLGGSGTISSGLAGQFSYYAANGTTLTGTSTLFILPTGLIGIGTTTPQAKLTIQGDGTANPFSIVSSTAATSSMLTVLTNGNVGINVAAPSFGILEANGTIASAVADGTAPTFYLRQAGQAAWSITNPASGDSLRITNESFGNVATFAYTTGRVGINTTTPLARLFVQGAGTENPFSVVSSTAAATSMFTVLTNGNVGINSSSPISAQLVIEGAVSASLAQIRLSNTAAGGRQYDLSAGMIGKTSAGFVIRDNTDGVNRLTIDRNGNVAINSSSVDFPAKFLVQGTGAENPFLIASTSASASSMFTVLTNGNVGINSSTPTAKLVVAGTSYFSQTSTFGGNISNIIDSNTVTSQIATLSVGASPLSIFVSGRYAYTANSTPSNITVIDVSNPAIPVLIATASVGNTPRSIYVSGRYAYTANSGADNISIVDISNPAVPTQIATANVGTGPYGIYVSGRYAYVANRDSDSISVIDISNPLIPVQVATTSVDKNPQSIFVSGRYAYTANFTSDTISVIDISNPTVPIQVATTSVGDGPYSVYVSGRYAYTANFNANNISIIDISNPAAPIQVATANVGEAPYSIHVSGRYAFIANRTSASISVVDISSSTAPVQVATANVGVNPQSIYVSGRYAYVGNNFSGTISVVDISGAEVTSLMAHSAEVGNLQSKNDIFAQGNIMAGTSLLVGAGGIMSNGSLTVFASTTGATSSIFDISSSQTSNIFKAFANGTIGVGTSTPIARLTIQGSGTANPFSIVSSTAAAGSMFTVLTNGNVGINSSSPIASFGLRGIAGINPLAIASSTGASLLTILTNGNVGINTSTPIARLTIQGGGTENPFSIVSSTAAADSMFTVLTNGNVGVNTSTPAAKFAVGGTSYFSQTSTFGGNISNIIDSNTRISQVSSTAVGTFPASVFVSGRYAYVANSTGNSISVVDVSNPAAPSQLATASVGNNPRSIYVSGQYAYTANNSADTISVVDISNPVAPRQVATANVDDGPYSIYVSGRYAYTANDNADTISVVDISNPLAPRQIATTSVGFNPQSVYVSGRYAYTANFASDTISVVDISNPATPIQISTTSVSDGPVSVHISGRYAYVANESSDSISVVDISNPSAPVQVASTSVGDFPYNIYVSGRYAYVANGSASSISVVDISSSTAPVVVATVTVGSGPSSIFVSGRYAYVTNFNDNNLSVLDISGTEVTSLMAHSGEFGNLQSRNDIFAQGNIMAGTSLLVGAGGIMSNGSLTVFASSTGATSSILSINSAQTSNIFNIFANGRVGIGTSTPVSKLTIQGSGNENPFSILTSTPGATQMFTVLTNGNIGINSSSPVSIFSVAGTSTFGGNVLPDFAPIAGASAMVSTTVDSTNNVGTSSAIAIGVDGYPVISYYDFTNGNLVVAKCGNASCSSGNVTTTIDYADDVGQYTSIAIGTDGFPVISYYDATEDGLYVAKCGNASCTSGNVTSSVAAGGSDGLYSSITIGTDGFPILSYYRASLQDLRVTKCGNAACNSGNVHTTVDGVGDQGQYTSIAIGTDGFPVISYYSVTDTALRFVKCGNISCSSGNVTTTVDNSSTIGLHTSLAVGTDGLPVISYYNAGSANLMVTKCGDAYCSAGNTTTPVDVIGSRGWYTSLAIGTDGLPAISYYDATNGNIIFAKCGNAACTTGNTTTTLYNAGSTNNQNTSLAIGLDGLPVISHYNSTNGDLIVTKCADGACRNTTGGSFTSGFSIGSLDKFFMNVYANSFWGKRFQIEGFDLAESYRVDDYSITAGDLVKISTSSTGVRPTVEKTSGAYDGVIGVISTNPGVRLSDWTDSIDGRLVSLSGRVPTKVSNENGPILAGDLIAASSLPGVGMKATGAGAVVGRALESFIGDGIGAIEVFINPSWAPGQSLFTINTASSTLTIGSSGNPYDLVVTGNIFMSNASLTNKLSFATTTLFESSVGGSSGANAFIFNAPNFSDTSADNHLISLRSNNVPVFSVAANGDVHAKGSYYGAGAILGTSTNPGDLAERVDIAIDDTVEAGDVMIIDKDAPDTYRRSGSAHEQSVAGIISTNPTIIVGNGKTSYTAVMAMVGRVPIKVSAENGSIQRGDLLVSASTAGFAMKYDPAKDNNNKLVGIIGVALEPLSASTTGKILALIRTGWVYNRDQAITNLQDSIEQMAVAQGIDLSSSSAPDNLNVANAGGQLTYNGGNLDLQNNSLINVAGITGKDDKWRIDEWGNLIQKIATANGDKETYGLQSSGKQEIIISGTSTLENGSKKVILTDLDQAIIDKTVPLKIFFSLSGETKGVYVSERNYDSFVIKENENGQSNAAFDWTVIAKILSPEAAAEQTDEIIESPGAGQTGSSGGAGTTTGETTPTTDSATSTPPVATSTPETTTTTTSPTVPATTDPAPTSPAVTDTPPPADTTGTDTPPPPTDTTNTDTPATPPPQE